MINVTNGNWLMIFDELIVVELKKVLITAIHKYGIVRVNGKLCLFATTN